MYNRIHLKHFFIAFVFSIFPFLAFKWNELWNYYSIYSDVAAHYLLYIFKDLNLFPEDILITYLKHGMTSWIKGMFCIWIFNWFYGLNCLLAILISPVLLLKFWFCLQFFVSSLLLFFTCYGKRLQQGLWVLFFYFIISFTMDIFQGGIPRGFGEVLIITFIYFFVHEKYTACWKTSACTLFIYPHILPFMLCNLFLFSNFKISKKTALWSMIIISFLLLSFFIFPIYQNDILNEQAKLAYSSYRYVLPQNHSPSFFSEMCLLLGNFINFMDHPGPYHWAIPFYILGTVILLAKDYHLIKYTKLSISFLKLMSGAIICFGLISLAGMIIGPKVFYFHIAGKQTKYFLPIFLSFICGFSFSRNFNPFTLLFFYLLFILITLYPQHNYNWNLSDKKNLYSFIQTLPSDSMILGNFKDTEFIPLYCKRQVYWMYIWTELSANENFHNQREMRTSLLNKLKYFSPPEMNKFLKNEKITHLVIDKRYPYIPFKVILSLLKNQELKFIFNDSYYLVYNILSSNQKEL